MYLREGQKGGNARNDGMGLEAAPEQDLKDNEQQNDDAKAASHEAQPSECLEELGISFAPSCFHTATARRIAESERIYT